jgi:hypothetical protein
MALAAGCRYLPSKQCCPVYLPQDHLLGSEAIRQPPCAPDGDFYGLKKTSWRQWPAEWQLCPPTNCPPQAMEMLPPATMLEGAPVEMERLQSVPPEGGPPAAEAGPPPEERLDPQRRVRPFDLFGPVEEDAPATPDSGPPPLDSIDQAEPPANPGQPPVGPGQAPRADSPSQPSAPGSVEPSSWSRPEGDSEAISILNSSRAGSQVPPGWPPQANSASRINTRAPRASKFRR